MSQLTFGITGYGSFGKLLAQLIAAHAPVVVSSRREIDKTDLSSNITSGSLTDIAKCDVIILCNELTKLEDNCRELANMVKPETIVMDVCSVKVLPAGTLKNELGDRCKVLATHPMFGPQSVVNNSARGKNIVWHELSEGPFDEIEQFMSETLGLNIIKMSPEEHDEHMAWVHGLTFFVGRALLHLDPPHSQLSTWYYDRLLNLVDVERAHSYELFRTVELGNSHAAGIRKQLLEEFTRLDEQLKKDHL